MHMTTHLEVSLVYHAHASNCIALLSTLKHHVVGSGHIIHYNMRFIECYYFSSLSLDMIDMLKYSLHLLNDCAKLYFSQLAQRVCRISIFMIELVNSTYDIIYAYNKIVMVKDLLCVVTKEQIVIVMHHLVWMRPERQPLIIRKSIALDYFCLSK